MNNFLPPSVQRSLSELNLTIATAHSIPEIPRMINKTLLFGGKRLRPALCFLMGDALGVDSKKLIPFARAAEFTHSASLAHDDVIDDAHMRRNLPTLNAATTNGRAVLAGDLLLARVLVELAQQGNIQIIEELAEVIENLVNGEWLQLDALKKIDISDAQLTDVSIRKTASLMSWCCKVAARLAPQADEKLISACQDFGLHLGIGFQMVDDVIDFESTSQKDYAQDLKKGLVNFVVAHLLQKNPSLKEPTAALLGNENVSFFPWNEDQLANAKIEVRNIAQTHLRQASENLEVIKSYASQDEHAQEAIQSLTLILTYLGVRES